MNMVKIYNYIGYRILNLSTFFIVKGLRADKIHRYNIETEAQYKKEDPYNMKRVTYPLNENSLVIDVGGLTGDWAARMYCLYSCFIDVYEPHPKLSKQAIMNFKGNKKVNIFNFGLGNKNDRLTLYGENANASLHEYDIGFHTQNIVDIKKTSEIFNKLYNNKIIDVLKINVEGAEYDILPDLIDNYDMRKIKNLQIQFHTNVDNYDQKRNIIRESLSKTHSKTWDWNYIFENWTLNE